MDEEESFGANLELSRECYSTTTTCAMKAGSPMIMQTYYPTVTLQSKLPTIEKVIHFIQNPADNIYSLFQEAKESKFFSSRIRGWNSHVDYELNEFKKFHDFWDRFASDLYTKTLVVRYEDFCLQPFEVIMEILEFINLPSHPDQLESFSVSHLKDLVSHLHCDPSLEIAASFSKYTDEQMKKIASKSADFIKKYDYQNLFTDRA